MVKRTAVAALTGILAVGMLAGCGEKKLDGTKTVATVDKTEIPMGVVSLMARQQQAQTEAMYRSFMGDSATSIWDEKVDEESGQTYGEQAVKQVLEQVELMYIMKEKAADYNVEITEDEQKAIGEAAAAFMKANDEETLEALAVSEDQVKTLLELQTYRERIHDALVAEANVEVSDEEAQQSAFTYVSVSTSGEDLTEEDIAKKKEQAQEILDTMKETPDADMDEAAKAVDESYSALSGTFTTKESEDEDASSSAYPEDVIKVLRELKEGEVADELIETDTSVYVVRLDKELDEEATESKKESLKSTKENEYYTETTQGWLEAADVKVEEKVLKGLTITDAHSFSIKTAAAEGTDAADTDAAEGTDEASGADAEGTDETAGTDTTEGTDEAAGADTTEGADEAAGADSTEGADETDGTDTADSTGGAADTDTEDEAEGTEDNTTDSTDDTDTSSTDDTSKETK